MNLFFVAAALLLVVVGAIHSVFGERWIFRRMRVAAIIPTNGGSVLREPHVRILWATWHLVTILGVCIALALGWMAVPHHLQMVGQAAPLAIIGAMLASALLVYIATLGKHMGWAGLLGVALLVGAGMRW